MINNLVKGPLWKAWQDFKRANPQDAFRPFLNLPEMVPSGIKLLEHMEDSIRDTGGQEVKIGNLEMLAELSAGAFITNLNLPNRFTPSLQHLSLNDTVEIARNPSDQTPSGKQTVTAEFSGHQYSITQSLDYLMEPGSGYHQKRNHARQLILAFADAAIIVWLKWLDSEISTFRQSWTRLKKNRSYILHEGQEISQLLSEAIAGENVPDCVRDGRDRLDTLLTMLREANDLSEELTLDVRAQAHGLKRIFDPDAFRRSFSETLGKSSANALVWGLTMLLLYLLGDAAIDANTDSPSPSSDDIHKV